MKKRYNNFLFYFVTIFLFLGLMYGIQILAKQNLENTGIIPANETSENPFFIFLDNFKEGIKNPLATLLLQLVIILFFVKLFGALCKKIGQPAVVGEIIAGIILGPSLLGLYFPNFSQFVFPYHSLHYIEILSQIGLILFMFIVGLELNLSDVRKKASEAILISHASIIFPFTLGFVLAYFMYSLFVTSNIPFISFALFMGISLSITAFPVLARIVHERGIHKTNLGNIVITCAAIDDITAWCLLATVITIVKANSVTGSLFVILIAVIYIIAMFKLVKPILKKLTDKLSSKKMMSRAMVILYFIILFLSSYATEIIGIHALFGAFIAGVIMPTSFKFREKITLKIEDITLIIFLPLFFVYTGLKTQIGLIDNIESWLFCFIIIIVAVLGKFLGSALAARFVGLNWKSSTMIGILMNTRGLMELVVLNIGLQLGILSPKVFSMMVLMAIVTTLMTSPLLNIIDKIFKKEKETSRKSFELLIPFDDITIGQKLFMFASTIFRKTATQTNISMLYVSEGGHLYQHETEQEEQAHLDILQQETSSSPFNVTIDTKVCNNPIQSITKYANAGEFQLILINNHNTISKETFLDFIIRNVEKGFNLPYLMGKYGHNKDIISSITAPFNETTRTIISKTDASVAVLIDNNLLPDIRKIFVPLLDEDDAFMGIFIEKIARNLNAQFLIWDSLKLSEQSIDLSKSLRNIKERNPYHYQEWNNNILLNIDVVKKHDLIILSLNSWIKIQKTIEEFKQDTLPSILVLTY